MKKKPFQARAQGPCSSDSSSYQYVLLFTTALDKSSLEKFHSDGKIKSCIKELTCNNTIYYASANHF